METQKEVLVQDKFRTSTACGGGARSFGSFFEWMGGMWKTITTFIGTIPRHQLECHNVQSTGHELVTDPPTKEHFKPKATQMPPTFLSSGLVSYRSTEQQQHTRQLGRPRSFT